ncbi:ABC transporter substrate-binding protein [Ochrobactrum sp. Sa2BUA5]|jgi:ABC-type Fe3+-citrate transport system substrate-binding protein|uniref:ABC transporter substrate-binding protein n=1 Tax=Ochrobactrum quorumnocens TaxID=271865 RepID=A0A5N1K080_9HYPH|nr:ABC transporter substrate-binding protein [[Ochrobactrum] quorumnocens]KAA9368929.1 ABC transporter substrate-binding protein [[Ochrobactrum] quorumnocens]MBD7990639.1 ABC transporter substrate-binding protein [Ochrobactrum gallinarum]
MAGINRREFNVAFMSMIIALAGTASYPALADDDVRSIKHEVGSTEITGKPTRVIALEFSFLQTLDALGVVPVGISDDNQAARVEQLLGKKIDYASVGTRLEPNLELISTLSPDLIIADVTRHSAVYQQLSSIAPTIVLNSWEGDYDTIKSSVITIAEALGERAKGDETIARHTEIMSKIIAQIPTNEQRRILLAVATPDSLSLHTSSSFTGSVFKAMGLPPAIQSDKPVESGANLERLIAVSPEILLIGADPGGTVVDQWKDNSAWTNIPAVQNKVAFEIDRTQFVRFRGLKIAELLAQEVLAKVYGGK